MPHAEALVNTKDHQQKREEKFEGENITELFNEQLTIGCFDLCQLECAGKQDNSEGTHLQRIVKLQAAGKKLRFGFVVLKNCDGGQQHEPQSNHRSDIDDERNQVKP